MIKKKKKNRNPPPGSRTVEPVNPINPKIMVQKVTISSVLSLQHSGSCKRRGCSCRTESPGGWGGAASPRLRHGLGLWIMIPVALSYFYGESHTLILLLLSPSLLQSLQGFFLFRRLTESARSHRDCLQPVSLQLIHLACAK